MNLLSKQELSLLSKPQLEKYRNALLRLHKIQSDYPLALAKLWVPICERWDGLDDTDRPVGCKQEMIYIAGNTYYCPTCDIREQRTSQRRFIQMAMEATEAMLGAGGNRSGKSESMTGQYAVATAASTSEWWVREWCIRNDLDMSLLPSKPSEVWVSGLSYGDALTYIRPKIEKYCPTGTKFKRWNAQDRAEAILPNGGLIRSLSGDAGREKFQGGAVKLAILDEEHPQEIFDECMLRCIDHKGKVILPMTALKGITWPFDVFIQNPPEGYKTYKISGLDNPHVDSRKLRRAVAHLSEAQQKARLWGDFANQQGLVYSNFDRNKHRVKSFNPPKEWERRRTIDFGSSMKSPFVCLYIAHDRKNDVIHVYREEYLYDQSTINSGRKLNENQEKYNEKYDRSIADPESRDGRLTLNQECGIYTDAPPKHLGVVWGINLVRERLEPDKNGKVHLVIHDCCVELIREFSLYAWSTGTGKDKPIKKNDHGMDALRYDIMYDKCYMMHF